MIINTYSTIENSTFGKKIEILDENEDMFNILSTGERILFVLKESEKTTLELARELDLGARCIRRNINNLEKDGFVKRKMGKAKNQSFRYSDSWSLSQETEVRTVVPNDHICIWYKTNHYLGGFKHHFIILPKTINLDDELALSFGFFMAEGSKSKTKTIEVTNNEPKLILPFLNLLTRFNIRKDDWKWRIVFNKKLKILLNEVELIELENLSKNFWMSNCNLKKEKFTSVNYAGQTSGKLKKDVNIWGTSNLYYNNLLLTKFLFMLFGNIRELIFEKEHLIVNYLKGYLSGEAYVGSHDREIQFASIDKKELNFAQRGLSLVGINSSLCKATTTSPPRAIITSLDNFLLLNELDIFECHLYKKRSLLQKILNYKTLDQSIKNKIKHELEIIERSVLLRKQPFDKILSKVSP